jgi:hypothetical protein
LKRWHQKAEYCEVEGVARASATCIRGFGPQVPLERYLARRQPAKASNAAGKRLWVILSNLSVHNISREKFGNSYNFL